MVLSVSIEVEVEVEAGAVTEVRRRVEPPRPPRVQATMAPSGERATAGGVQGVHAALGMRRKDGLRKKKKDKKMVVRTREARAGGTEKTHGQERITADERVTRCLGIAGEGSKAGTRPAEGSRDVHRWQWRWGCRRRRGGRSGDPRRGAGAGDGRAGRERSLGHGTRGGCRGR